jgi:hypothetical protein
MDSGMAACSDGFGFGVGINGVIVGIEVVVVVVVVDVVGLGVIIGVGGEKTISFNAVSFLSLILDCRLPSLTRLV